MPCEVTHILVYGTLLRGEPNHARFCADALTIEPASTRGRLYHLAAGFPAMVEDAEGTVYGEAMTFPDLQAALARIDLLEGYRPERPERSLYLRRVQLVTLLRTGEAIPAYCYVWRGPLPEGAVRVPSGRWLSRP
jgi:gamma-glutamylcyclotransferase (GGCT)/AIG2-like uncharacterized protein YtfP